MEGKRKENHVRILLVEDDPRFVEVVRVYLGAVRPRRSHSVDLAETLREALAKGRHEAYDIVLLDLNLPDSVGLETLDKALGAFRRTPVVVMTGHTEGEFGLEAITRGAQDFLSKSKIDGDSVWRAIRFALERARQRRQLDAMLRGVTDGIVVVDGERKIHYANRAAAEFLRLPFETIVGGRFPLQLDQRRREFTLRDHRGQERVLIVRQRPIDWDAENPRLVTMHDITEIRRLEAARAEMRSRKKTAAMKDEFLSNLFHEMRSPLTVAHSVLRILGGDRKDQFNEKTQTLIAAGLRNMDRLIRTVCDLLDLSRLESGRAGVKFARFSMMEAVLEAVDDARHISKEGLEIAVENSGTPASLDVHADRDMIMQLLHNLLDNAMRFSRGLVRVRIGKEKSGRRVRVDVIDNGPGIPEPELPGVFDRYSQVARKGGHEYKGTGLGLPICRELVQLNKGAIEVANDPAGGARISFSIPAVPVRSAVARGRGVESAKKETARQETVRGRGGV